MFTSRLTCLASLTCFSLLLACGDDKGRGDSMSGTVTGIASLTTIGNPSSSGGSGGGSTEGSGTEGVTSSPTSTTMGMTNGMTSNGPGGPKFDLGVVPDGGMACGGGGMIDNSYIWIPSTSDGWVSKINTRTMVEEARYLTGPSGGTESVSRTAVSGDGRFVVINARGTGRSTAVAANVADCKDTNADGMITTSSGPADVKPWGGDECVLWTLVHPTWDSNYQHGPRGITWTLGTYDDKLCGFVDPKVWLGYGSGGDAHFVKLNGLTGTLEEMLVAPGWNGSGYAPYGGALDPQQRPWFTGLRGELMRVNTDQNPTTLTRIPQPGNIQTYGMTVDPDGNPWMAGCSGPVSTYDINSAQWISIAGTSACHRGMAVDHDGHAWVASNGPCEIVEVDTKTRTLIAHHQLAQCSTAIGVSVDVDGFVWLVDQEGWAWKIDPKNVGGMQMMQVPGSHYVYSDMTGGQLKSVAPPLG